MCDMAGAVALALLSAFLVAMSTVAQQRAAFEVPDADAGHGKLMATLIRRPLWWAGMVGDSGGYLAQAAALALGSLLLVQPLLVTALLFALPLGAHYANRRVSNADWAAALALTASLALFVVVGNPQRGDAHGTVGEWLVVIAVLAPILAFCLAFAAMSKGIRRAALLAISVGLLYGVTAVLTKAVVDLIGQGLIAVLTSPETYALAACGIAGTVLQQSAFQAGALQASLPTMTVLEPAVATVLGLVILGEKIDTDGLGWMAIAAAVACMVASTVALARSSARVESAAASATAKAEAARAAPSPSLPD